MTFSYCGYWHVLSLGISPQALGFWGGFSKKCTATPEQLTQVAELSLTLHANIAACHLAIADLIAPKQTEQIKNALLKAIAECDQVFFVVLAAMRLFPTIHPVRYSSNGPTMQR